MMYMREFRAGNTPTWLVTSFVVYILGTKHAGEALEFVDCLVSIVARGARTSKRH